MFRWQFQNIISWHSIDKVHFCLSSLRCKGHLQYTDIHVWWLWASQSIFPTPLYIVCIIVVETLNLGLVNKKVSHIVQCCTPFPRPRHFTRKRSINVKNLKISKEGLYNDSRGRGILPPPLVVQNLFPYKIAPISVHSLALF